MKKRILSILTAMAIMISVITTMVLPAKGFDFGTNANDVFQIHQHMLGLPSDFRGHSGDMNNDGVVDYLDAALIHSMALNLRDSQSIGLTTIRRLSNVVTWRYNQELDYIEAVTTVDIPRYTVLTDMLTITASDGIQVVKGVQTRGNLGGIEGVLLGVFSEEGNDLVFTDYTTSHVPTGSVIVYMAVNASRSGSITVTPKNDFSQVINVAPKSRTLGDVNGDGIVNDEDIWEILQYLTKGESIINTSPEARNAADVNQDGKIDSLDVVEILLSQRQNFGVRTEAKIHRLSDVIEWRYNNTTGFGRGFEAVLTSDIVTGDIIHDVFVFVSQPNVYSFSANLVSSGVGRFALMRREEGEDVALSITQAIATVVRHDMSAGTVILRVQTIETVQNLTITTESGDSQVITTSVTGTLPPVGQPYSLGDVTGTGAVSISDALEILKLLAGLQNDITGNAKAERASNIVSAVGEKPNISDVLEILKKLAGLPNAIDTHNAS
jgi:acyl carrier protein